MARVKRGVTAKARHKKILRQAKGFRHGRKNVFRQANQAVRKAAKNSYIGRKLKKRNFRSLWILRINAACRKNGVKYNQLIKSLQTKDGGPDRKKLAEIAQDKPDEFAKLAEEAKKN